MLIFPQTKYFIGDKKPPTIGTGLFSWVSPLIHTKEPQMLEQIGLDAVTFLRFLRMLRWLFLSIAIVTCGVLIPINVIYNIDRRKKAKINPKNVDFLQELTIVNLKGNILFAHVAVTYLISRH
jgi:calcium permeable stress-gated cation channel